MNGAATNGWKNVVEEDIAREEDFLFGQVDHGVSMCVGNAGVDEFDGASIKVERHMVSIRYLRR